MAIVQHKRIARNTLMLYLREGVSMLIGLYTVRITLEVLGVTNFGVYNAVAGVVTLLSFLSGSMASASQRFFSFAIGSSDTEKLHRIFSTNWIAYAAISFIAILLLETVGLWFVKTELVVPEGMHETVQWVYHAAVVSLILGILCTPFRAALIAHEDMHIFATVSIVESVVRLGAILLLLILPGEKLIVYAFLLLALSVLRILCFGIICARRYPECQFKNFHWDRQLFREIFGFTGWTIFGQITTVMRNQAITVLLNQMFNPAVVTSRAIAISINSHLSSFASNFNTGLYPPIIKSYAAGDRKSMYSLINNGAKFTFFMMWFFSLPLLLEMNTVLRIWLGNKTPPDAALFAQLCIVESLIWTISQPLATAARAPGRMKMYELTLGCLQLAIFAISWLVLKLGTPAYSVFVVAIAVNVVMLFTRLIIVRSLIHMPLMPFFKGVLAPLSVVMVLSLIGSFIINRALPDGLAFRAISAASSALLSCVCMYFIGLNPELRKQVKIATIRKLSKIFGREFA